MLKKLFTLSTLLFAACGDDNKTTQDAGPGSDVLDVDAMVDAAPTWNKPTPFAIAVSPLYPDVAMSAAAGPSGSFYVAGYVATSAANTTRYPYVARLTAAGALDATFNASGTLPGVYVSTVEFAGNNAGSDEIDVVVQSTGHVVVSFSIANDSNPDDRDIGLIRLSSAGALDTDFGDAGLARVDISTAHDNNGTLSARDQARALAVGPSDILYLHAIARDVVADSGDKTDTEFAVAKLTTDGALDTNYGGGDGFYLLDIVGGTPPASSPATPRGLVVLSDGSVIASGYANSGITNSTQPVLYKLTPTGTSDTNWAGGLFHDVVLGVQTEIYNFSIDGDRLTTAGYGRESDTSTNCCNEWVSLRFDADTGVRNTSFGGATSGAVVVNPDPTLTMAGHNCRNAIGLPGGKTVLLGSSGSSPSQNASFAILTQGGQLDTSYGTGYATWDINGGAGDQWWGGATSGGKLLLAGWRGVATQMETADQNNDSYGVLIDLE